MPYIDKDLAIKRVAKELGERSHIATIDVANALYEMPNADVVPKSEVDLYRKQVDELEDELASTYDKLETAKTEVAREIFAEIEKLKHTKWDWNDVVEWDKIAELKKKYVEHN